MRKADAQLAQSKALRVLPGPEAGPEASSCCGHTYVFGSRDTGVLAARPFSLFACIYVCSGESRSEERKRMDCSSLVSSSVDHRLDISWKVERPTYAAPLQWCYPVCG